MSIVIIKTKKQLDKLIEINPGYNNINYDMFQKFIPVDFNRYNVKIITKNNDFDIGKKTTLETIEKNILIQLLIKIKNLLKS